MDFMFGCLAIIAIVASLVMSTVYSTGKYDCCIVHWLFGFIAALISIGLMILGIC